MTRLTAFAAGLCVGVVVGVYLLTKRQAEAYGHTHDEWLGYQEEVLDNVE